MTTYCPDGAHKSGPAWPEMPHVRQCLRCPAVLDTRTRRVHTAQPAEMPNRLGQAQQLAWVQKTLPGVLMAKGMDEAEARERTEQVIALLTKQKVAA